MRRKLFLLLALGFGAVGCSSDGVTPGQQNQVEFSQFVRDQIATTADDTDPVAINELDLIDLFGGDDFGDLLR